MNELVQNFNVTKTNFGEGSLAKLVFCVRELNRVHGFFADGIRVCPSPEEIKARGLSYRSQKIESTYFDEDGHFVEEVIEHFFIPELQLSHISARKRLNKIKPDLSKSIETLNILLQSIKDGVALSIRSLPSFAQLNTFDAHGVVITLSPKLSPTPIASWR